MKNQYFGDRRDFFKYDLVLTFIEKINSLRAFAFIPMLTENDDTEDGNLTQYDGSRRKDLEEFLRNCLSTSSRDIQNLKVFMRSQVGADYNPYKETEYFYHTGRQQYFAGIESSFLNNAVVLIDPDTGFEVKNMKRRNQYLRFSELRQVFDRSVNSLVMVYQHIPREKRPQYFARMSDTLKNCLGIDKCICVTDNEIVFFLVTSSNDLLQDVCHEAEEYSKINKYKTYIL